MKIGIVSTWFERGAAYVSKQFEDILNKEHSVFIYARGGEKYAIGDPLWDQENVTWGKEVWLPTVTTPIDKKDFLKWIKVNSIEAILFNEQHWWEPLIWCREIGVKTIAYIDYYKENTLQFYGIYNYLICNTKRHYNTFSWHPGAHYIPWGTNIDLFSPETHPEADKTFFHSAGMAPYRKGTDILLKAFSELNTDWKLIIHAQTSLSKIGKEDLTEIIDDLIKKDRLEIIKKSVPAPGLYHLGQVYVYPSRLDGIGLTVAESMACGLIPILPDNAPMNEFVPTDYEYLVPVKKYFARSDGYYWPIGEIKKEDLLLKLNEIIQLKSIERKKLQQESRIYAQENLSWRKNSEEVLALFRDFYNSPTQPSHTTLNNIEKDIQEFSNHGINRFNNIILDYNFIIKPFVKTFKAILN